MKKCYIERCSNKSMGYGLCVKHYSRIRRAKLNDKSTAREWYYAVMGWRETKECEVPGCSDPMSARKMCWRHYNTIVTGVYLTLGNRQKWKCGDPVQDWLIEKGCGEDLDTVSRYQVNVDHIVPRSRGGADGLDNLQLLCVGCNKKAGDYWQGEQSPIDRGIGG